MKYKLHRHRISDFITMLKLFQLDDDVYEMETFLKRGLTHIIVLSTQDERYTCDRVAIIPKGLKPIIKHMKELIEKVIEKEKKPGE